MQSFADNIVLSPTQLLIGGEWRESARRTRFGTLNPATEETIAEVAEGGGADIDAAVAAARTALKRGPWPVMSGAERGRILHRLAAIMRERREELVLLESLDGGKPLTATCRPQSIASNIMPAGRTRSPARWCRPGAMR
jgi:acyl-CoA reductase-like NAD-dependent aldehyde dehydrogenase